MSCISGIAYWPGSGSGSGLSFDKDGTPTNVVIPGSFTHKGIGVNANAINVYPVAIATTYNVYVTAQGMNTSANNGTGLIRINISADGGAVKNFDSGPGYLFPANGIVNWLGVYPNLTISQNFRVALTLEGITFGSYITAYTVLLVRA